MSQLLSGKQKGRFAAPPNAKSRRPWWYTAPVHLLVAPTVVLLALTFVIWNPYFSCYDAGLEGEGAAFCVGVELLDSSTGSYRGIVFFTGGLLLLAIVCMLLAEILIRRLPFYVLWPLAATSTASVIATWMIMSGNLGTPFGRLLTSG